MSKFRLVKERKKTLTAENDLRDMGGEEFFQKSYPHSFSIVYGLEKHHAEKHFAPYGLKVQSTASGKLLVVPIHEIAGDHQKHALTHAVASYYLVKKFPDASVYISEQSGLKHYMKKWVSINPEKIKNTIYDGDLNKDFSPSKGCLFLSSSVQYSLKSANILSEVSENDLLITGESLDSFFSFLERSEEDITHSNKVEIKRSGS